nr:hypothetical protein [Escherichia coli]
MSYRPRQQMRRAPADDLEPLRAVAGVHRLLGLPDRYEYDRFGQMTAVHREEGISLYRRYDNVAG